MKSNPDPLYPEPRVPGFKGPTPKHHANIYLEAQNFRNVFCLIVFVGRTRKLPGGGGVRDENLEGGHHGFRLA